MSFVSWSFWCRLLIGPVTGFRLQVVLTPGYVVGEGAPSLNRTRDIEIRFLNTSFWVTEKNGFLFFLFHFSTAV